MSENLSCPFPPIAIIGVSTGGPATYPRIFMELPVLRGSVILVQHMPLFINKRICEGLCAMTDMRVKIAEDGERIAPGSIYIAPSEKHLKLVDNKSINLCDGEKVHFCRPSIDVTLQSVTRLPHRDILGIIMTGMGNDGAAGIKHLKSIGGITVAQDEESSIIFSMPKSAIATSCVDYILSPEQIKQKLIDFLG